MGNEVLGSLITEIGQVESGGEREAEFKMRNAILAVVLEDPGHIDNQFFNMWKDVMARASVTSREKPMYHQLLMRMEEQGAFDLIRRDQLKKRINEVVLSDSSIMGNALKIWERICTNYDGYDFKNRKFFDKVLDEMNLNDEFPTLNREFFDDERKAMIAAIGTHWTDHAQDYQGERGARYLWSLVKDGPGVQEDWYDLFEAILPDFIAGKYEEIYPDSLEVFDPTPEDTSS